MVDRSLLNVTEDGLYRIADPIRNAAINVFGFLDKGKTAMLARSLSDYLEENAISTSRLDLSSVLFKASRICGMSDISNRASDSQLIRLI